MIDNRYTDEHGIVWYAWPNGHFTGHAANGLIRISIELTPAGNYRAYVNEIRVEPTAERYEIILDKKQKVYEHLGEAKAACIEFIAKSVVAFVEEQTHDDRS